MNYGPLRGDSNGWKPNPTNPTKQYNQYQPQISYQFKYQPWQPRNPPQKPEDLPPWPRLAIMPPSQAAISSTISTQARPPFKPDFCNNQRYNFHPVPSQYAFIATPNEEDPDAPSVSVEDNYKSAS